MASPHTVVPSDMFIYFPSNAESLYTLILEKFETFQKFRDTLARLAIYRANMWNFWIEGSDIFWLLKVAFKFEAFEFALLIPAPIEGDETSKRVAFMGKWAHESLEELSQRLEEYLGDLQV